MLFDSVRYGLRSSHRDMLFIAAVLLCIGLATGATTAVYSFADALFIRDLPFPESGRLAVFFEVDPRNTRTGVSWPIFNDIRARADVIETLAIYSQDRLTVADLAGADRIRVMRVTAEYFDLYGIPMILGSGFNDHVPDDDVIILSRGYWLQRYGGHPSVLGQPMRFIDKTRTVIGVAGGSHDSVHGWVPLRPGLVADLRAARGFTAVGRIRREVSLDVAQQRLNDIALQMAAEYPATNAGWGLEAVPLRRHLTAPYQASLATLSIAATCILLVAAINLIGLFRARAAVQSHRTLIRYFLGARRANIVSELLAESLWVSLLGGMTGVGGAYVVVHVLTAILPQSPSDVFQVTFGWRVILFALMTCSLVTVTAGLLPALRLARVRWPELALSAAGVRVVERSSAPVKVLSGTILCVQTAAVTAIVVTAWLFVRSHASLLAIDPGFEPRGAVAVSVNLITDPAVPAERLTEFYKDLLTHLAMDRGVGAAAVTDSLPMAGGTRYTAVWTEGVPSDEYLPAQVRSVSPHYFRAMGIPVRNGRVFGDRDARGAPLVVVVNEVAARQLWHGAQAIGRRVLFEKPVRLSAEVIGVVGGVRHRNISTPPAAEVYLSCWQESGRGATVVLRTEESLSGVHSLLRGLVRDLGLPAVVEQPRRLTDLVASGVISDSRRRALLFSVTAFVGLLLGAAGIFAGSLYATTRRTHEMAVRIALGAGPSRVLWELLAPVGAALVAGIAIGLVGAHALARLVRAFLYSDTLGDPLAWVVPPAVVLTVGIAAAYLGTRRAVSIEPAVLLRNC